MQITNTPNTHTPQTFQGRYLIKGGSELVKILQTEVLPAYKIVRPAKPVSILPVDNIFRSFLSKTVDKEARAAGYGREWFLQNAQRHGVEIDLKNKEDIFLMSGDDFFDLDKYMLNRVSFMGKLKNFFLSIGDYMQAKNQLPHLQSIDFASRVAKKQEAGFYDFINKKPCKKVNDIHELMFELLTEK